MDNDVIISQFDDIEEKVEFLIELCQSLESANSELQEKITKLEHELQNRAEIENRHAEERNQIRSRMDSLMTKLDNFSEVS